MKALALVPALALAAFALAAPPQVEAAHRHGPSRGRGYYSRGYDYGRSYDRYYRGNRHYAERYYGGRYYGYYGYGDYGYYGSYPYGYGYYGYYPPPPPPFRYHRRPRIGIFFRF
jgi:hypothetical protein